MQEEEDRRLDAEANALEDGTNLETSATEEGKDGDQPEEDGGEVTEAGEAATGTADGGGAVATEEPPATEPMNA